MVQDYSILGVCRPALRWVGILALLAAGCGGNNGTDDLDGRGGGDSSHVDVREDGGGGSDGGGGGDASAGDGHSKGTDVVGADGNGGGDGGRDGGGGGGPEVCYNGVDDDGDGQTDEGCACLPGETQTCYGGPADRAGVGLCARGNQRCVGDGEFGTWGACENWTPPAGEACDGLDNDCDGQVDNGCDCRAGDTRPCYSGPAATRGVGVCRDGAETCMSGAGGIGSAWGSCTGETLPQTETCDGVDNDCDGLIDEGCTCTPGTTRTCYGGPAGTAGVGPCRSGSQTCTSTGGGGSEWGTCEGEVRPQPELCDGVDNDCNGTVDNGCECTAGTTRSCYTGPSGTAGVGVCRAGSQTCESGPGGVGTAWGTCTGQVLPSSEVCDRLDNNCDGTVDEDAGCGPTVTCPAPVRAPAGTTVTLTASATGASSYRWEVTATNPPGSAYSFGSPTTSSTSFSSVIVGVYDIRVTVTDSMGRTASCMTQVTYTGRGLRVEMVWDTADDVDLQVHNSLATSWRTAPNTCYYANRSPSWHTASVEDDPRLDTDDTDGLGPENIRINEPVVSETYSVGAHYYRAVVPSSNVTIRIYCGESGTPAATFMRRISQGVTNTPDSNDFWRVARVQFTSPTSCTVTPIGDVITGGQASSGYP